MPSILKSEAARANGAKSRGPKTAEGRAKSSRNALRHGFTSRSTIILEVENPTEFQQLLDEYKTTYLPETAAEQDLVDQMVAARWRIRRLWTIETALIDTEIVRREPQVQREFTKIDGGIRLALAFQSLADGSRALSLISRYESRLSRMHDRAYAVLRELQRERENKKLQNEPTVVEKSNDLNSLTAQPLPEPPNQPLPQASESDKLDRPNPGSPDGWKIIGAIGINGSTSPQDAGSGERAAGPFAEDPGQIRG